MKFNYQILIIYIFNIVAHISIPPLIAYELEILEREKINTAIDDLAYLCITVFQEYLYLYDGGIEYEKSYLSQYLCSEQNICVLAKNGEEIIGAIIGIPLNEAFFECRDPFMQKNVSMNGIFYLGEIMLLKEYRGQGIGVRMYELFEELVRKLNTYQQIAFYEVVSLKNDPKNTSNYFCLDKFWTKRDFTKYPELVTQFYWKEIGQTCALQHPMVCWMKNL